LEDKIVMKKPLLSRGYVIWLIFVIAIIGCTPTKQIAKNEAPTIHFEQLSYNFGKVQKGQKVVYDFKFTNIGREKLVIFNVESSCGCTVALLSSKELLPGASGTIKATFDSTAYIGPVTKIITVTDNDPEKPVVTLTITGEVITDIMSDKPALFFGSVESGKTAQQPISIFLSNPAIKITSVTVTKPYIKVTTSATSASQDIFNVSILPNAELGPLNAEILFFSSSKEQPILKVPVVANIVKNARQKK
jgi:hypothetical protein